ncbi:carnitine O-palmitoyltransferase 1, liver isoform-like isoform X2 [Halichondria panicea]|uniref:carnitine O-palmitoyltransferase 1, liver isoform-like isoform X2 n=1 Tax=Halichondria panicea TaxID=6063 RepID=UPI00312B97F2
MAEAHQAVAFQFRVTEEGIDVHFDRDAIRTALRSLLGLFRSRYLRLRNTLLRGVFPASPLSLVLVISLVIGAYSIGHDPSYGVIAWIQGGQSDVLPTVLTWLLLVTQSVFLWLLLSYIQRYSLKALLCYQGWMFDERGKQSVVTKVWALLVTMLTGPFKPMLNSYQKALPRLPVPPLKDTCQRYLDSVRPLLDDEQYTEMVGLVEEFKSGPGKKMQRYLVLKSWWASNYVTDWWETYVYLYGRSSIMINSNYYACDSVAYDLTRSPVARAAMISYTTMRFKVDIERERLKPLVVLDLVPLCSAQYERVFGTTRIPGVEADKLAHVTPNECLHCVVYKAGRWYKVQLATPKRLFTPPEIQQQYEAVFADAGEGSVSWGEEHLAALTAWDRKSWAETRQQYFSSGINKVSMETIDKAAFVMFFDEHSPSMSSDDGDCLTSYCKDLLHGSGHSRWFDKSLTLVTFNNGRFGINAEHSWADAPIVGYLLEYCCNLEHNIGYHENGSCKGRVETTPPKPQRLEWDITTEAVSRIDAALTFALDKIADTDVYVLEHSDFGKGDIKKCKISPDAFIQMALQLAYYKDSNSNFCLTYEASMTRLFLEGRTETVRPVTMESTAFVRAMCDPNASNEERECLLRVAVDRHALSYKLAMTGKGVDRHLFCLYVMSRYLKLESPFLAKVLGEPWKLSTSQTPGQQTGKIDFNKMPKTISPGGGFGPVAADGYGVSYIIQGDYFIYFHVSSFHSAPNTNSKKFAETIKQSMADMRDLVLSK